MASNNKKISKNKYKYMNKQKQKKLAKQERNKKLKEKDQIIEKIEPKEEFINNKEIKDIVEDENNVIKDTNIIDEDIELLDDDFISNNKQINNIEENDKEEKDVNLNKEIIPKEKESNIVSTDEVLNEETNNVVDEITEKSLEIEQEDNNDKISDVIDYNNEIKNIIEENTDLNSNEEVINKESDNKLEESKDDKLKTSELDHIKEIDNNTDIFIPNEIKMPKAEIENSSKEEEKIQIKEKIQNTGNSKRYVSFEKRLFRIIIVLIIFISILISSAILLLNYVKNNKVIFNENSSSTYSVCLEKNDYYKDECLGEDKQYLSSIVNNINYVFTYNALYQEFVDKTYEYYVDSDLKIYSEDNEKQVLFENNDIILPKKKVTLNSNVATVSDSVKIPFTEYNRLVNEYNSKYGVLTKSEVDINFYLNGKVVSSIKVPLGETTFNITKQDTTNRKTFDKKISESINSYTLTYILCFIVSLIIVIIYVTKLIKFILKFTTKSNEQLDYNKELENILKTFDRIIVEVDNIDSLLENKNIIQINNFLELVDARDTLDKPIMHVKINSVKDGFYVDDDDKIYTYIMKISDEKKD